MDYTKQLLRVAEIEQVNEWVRRYRLCAAEAGDHPAPFLPGQYINLFYEIEGATATRPYSIASSPMEAAQGGYYDLYIHGGGSFTSAWLFRNIGVGDTIPASLPIGEFCLGQDHSKIIVGISGGMSITPLRSMAHAVADGSIDAELFLFCGWDSPEEVLYFDEFMALQQICPRFHAVYAVTSRPLPGMVQGYITSDLIASVVRPEDAEFFLCGPQEMYLSLARQFSRYTIAHCRYHQELPGEIKENPHAASSHFEICVAAQDKSYRIPASGSETVLIALERAGLRPEARCRSGKCGFCLSRLSAGSLYVDPARDTRTALQKQEGLFHPCCSFPLSDLEIELP